jgi:hypothetical protein
VVVVNGVDNRDMAVLGCADVICCDVAGAGDGGGLVMMQQRGVLGGLRGSVDVPASLSGRGGSS